jgi:hypothetical protein
MKLKPGYDIDRSAGISCAATPAQGSAVQTNPDNDNHERSTRLTSTLRRPAGAPQL